MKYTEKRQVAEAQMRLLEKAADAGWMPRENWRSHFPKVVRVVVTLGPSDSTFFQGKPDDDLRVETESAGVTDPGRTVNEYSADYQWQVWRAGLGDWVRVDVTNYWVVQDPNQVILVPWVAHVEYEVGRPRRYTGGRFENIGLHPNRTRHENGGFVIEPPEPYRLPYWLKDKTPRGGGVK
ncbi:MAG: hypothetical protein AAF571_07050 [Verrucomicrobiota bacterium]